MKNLAVKNLMPLCLAACLALTHPLATLAGALSVDSGMPVFVPLLAFPGDQTASGVAGAAASGSAPAADRVPRHRRRHRRARSCSLPQ